MRRFLEPLLPDGIETHWFADVDEAIALAPMADIGWLDILQLEDDDRPVIAATKARWLHTTLAGLSKIPVDVARERGLIVTKGSGLTSDAVADFTMLGVLTLAKRMDALVRAFDKRDWLAAPPGEIELDGASALVIGYGEIGRRIGTRLAACGMAVTGVRRHADPANAILAADDWRARLADFDWIILAAPETGATRHMIGAAELAAMKAGARLVNIARGSLIDQPALVAALASGHLAGALLDVTDPEPLPADHPLWDTPNLLITMHMAGRFTQQMAAHAAERFAGNLRRYLAGEPLEAQVDLELGY